MIATALATLALAITPTIEFTSDSVYKKDNVLGFSVSERSVSETEGSSETEGLFYTLNVKRNYVLGYDVFDDPATPYVDGIKVDGQFLDRTWTVPDFDPDAEHSVLVKTVYSNDIGGWFAQAKDGDFSAIFSNPITVLQLVYYVLAAGSLIAGGLGLFRSRKRRAKTSAEIAAAVSERANAFEERASTVVKDLEEQTLGLVADVVGPMVETLSKQNETLIKATVLARNGDETSTLALLDLLKETGVKGVSDMSEAVKARIVESKAKAEKAKKDAIVALKEAVAAIPVEPGKEDPYDGTSI